jgi:hypothetical protein
MAQMVEGMTIPVWAIWSGCDGEAQSRNGSIEVKSTRCSAHKYLESKLRGKLQGHSPKEKLKYHFQMFALALTLIDLSLVANARFPPIR